MKTLPVHLDLFALIILLGVAQGLFLGIFFLTGSRARNLTNRCIGWFMLGLSAIIAEIFLCYTNYMFQVLWLVDFSEPINFTLGPVFYFFVFARLHKRLPAHWRWHLVPALIWLINSFTWIYQSAEFKYNSYISAYHPELSYVPKVNYIEEDFTGLRGIVSELTMLSCLIYAVLAFIAVRKAFRQQNSSFWGNAKPGLRQVRNLVLLNLAFPIFGSAVKTQFYEDLGDYILACYITLIIYTMSFLVMRGSDFFAEEPAPEPETDLPSPRKKYEKSSLSEEVEEAVLQKLTRLMEDEKPYLESDLSLPKLAQRLKTTPHHLSQLLNDRLEQSFFDLLATYRIREAQQLLQDPATFNLKIDEIAERVGYNSTSAFHTAFKRLTNQTPAQFRATATSSRSA
ncbi:helix-turn-helix transcriptional regulator [Larkinella terrae]|uniref:Helix-turn-helix domain-containing protein n=1 Tax=Larkinella terrae TaxID=2025311 RepID=A0A7K0EVK8_9BACT|nr:helix-turn-helix transcriptional regulator [Larkinella terrae]MRS65458.1 helix-turn-helix domain-containing protein [Larkinella terrae]